VASFQRQFVTINSVPSTKPSAKPTRRPYATPKLVSYGDAVSVTLSSKLLGKQDGVTKLKSRTR